VTIDSVSFGASSGSFEERFIGGNEMTSVFMQLPVQGEKWVGFERFVSSPENWLPTPVLAIGSDRWLTDAKVGPVSHPIVVSVVRAWRLPDARSRHIRWEPYGEGARLPREHIFPTFVGQLTLRSSAASGLWLDLNGHYVPPGGHAGEVLDRVVLHRAGDATVLRFVREVAARLGEPVPQAAMSTTVGSTSAM
jgi:hypothetical protein